jgi:hypothetical protein
LSFHHKSTARAEKRNRSQALRRFIRPDLIIESNTKKIDNNVIEGNFIKIIDYKDVPLKFYKNKKLAPKSANKYHLDIIKQLTYEYALQQTHEVSASEFFIPYYYNVEPSNPLGELEQKLNLNGIVIFRANFSLIQNIYLEDNL